MLKNPDKYNVSVPMLKTFIKVFYKTLWAGGDEAGKLKLEVYPGAHTESAFIEIRNEEQCTVEAVAPIFTCRDGGPENPSYYINHIDSVAVRR